MTISKMYGTAVQSKNMAHGLAAKKNGQLFPIEQKRKNILTVNGSPENMHFQIFLTIFREKQEKTVFCRLGMRRLSLKMEPYCPRFGDVI